MSDRPPTATGMVTRGDYAALTAQVRDMGLMGRRHVAYGVRAASLLVVGSATLAGVVLLGVSWWQLPLAAVLGVVTSQLGFLAHDAAHRQVFDGTRANVWTARLVSTLLVGLSYGWWQSKHSRHHRSPNEVGRDPDVSPGGLVFTSADAGRRRAVLALVARHQGWLFFPMLLLEGANLHLASVRTLLRRPDLPHQRLELVLLALRLVLPVALLLAVWPPPLALAFTAVHVAVFGALLGAAFAPNHKGMPMVAQGTRLDFISRQVLSSRNITGGVLVDIFLGGLNYQVEHHLFPSMARDNLRLAQPVVRAFCLAHDLAYTQSGLMASYGSVVRHLSEVGLAARDPFSCPFVTMHRG